MTITKKTKGVALVSTALILPILVLLLVGSVILGLSIVEDLRLERATTDAALLSEPEARDLVSSVGGEILCYWQGSGSGGCYNDGLTLLRTQIIGEGRTWNYPTGTITPTAFVSRPIEVTETTTTTEGP